MLLGSGGLAWTIGEVLKRGAGSGCGCFWVRLHPSPPPSMNEKLCHGLGARSSACSSSEAFLFLGGPFFRTGLVYRHGSLPRTQVLHGSSPSH